MAEKIVVFGAGATGRGHVGLLAWQAGFEMVFVDKKPDLVDALRRAGRYTVKLYGEEPAGDRRLRLSGLSLRGPRGDCRGDPRRGAGAHGRVRSEPARRGRDDRPGHVGLCRAPAARTPLNCIACENMMDSSSTLGKHVRQLLERRRPGLVRASTSAFPTA